MGPIGSSDSGLGRRARRRGNRGTRGTNDEGHATARPSSFGRRGLASPLLAFLLAQQLAVGTGEALDGVVVIGTCGDQLDECGNDPLQLCEALFKVGQAVFVGHRGIVSRRVRVRFRARTVRQSCASPHVKSRTNADEHGRSKAAARPKTPC